MSEKVVSIDEAIRILETMRDEKGVDQIIVSVFDEENGISYNPYRSNIKHGISIIKKSSSKIIYNKSFFDAIYTRNGTKRKTILMH